MLIGAGTVALLFTITDVNMHAKKRKKTSMKGPKTNPITQRRCRDFQCAEENRADFLTNFTDPTCSRPVTVIRWNEITAVFVLKTHVSVFCVCLVSFFWNPATSATHRCCWFHRVWAEGRLSNLMSSKKRKFNNDMLVLSHETRKGPTITLAINKSLRAESTTDWKHN